MLLTSYSLLSYALAYADDSISSYEDKSAEDKTVESFVVLMKERGNCIMGEIDLGSKLFAIGIRIVLFFLAAAFVGVSRK